MEEIGKQVVSRYSEGGIVSLSFGLLLIALLWDAWQSRKQATADRTTYTEHVVKFATVMADNTKVMDRSSAALEDIAGEVRALSNGVEKLGERVGRLEGR